MPRRNFFALEKLSRSVFRGTSYFFAFLRSLADQTSESSLSKISNHDLVLVLGDWGIGAPDSGPQQFGALIPLAADWGGSLLHFPPIDLHNCGGNVGARYIK